MPKLIMLAAITLDGKIAKDKDHFSGWTSKEDKWHMHEVMDTCDVFIVGNNTYKTASQPLSRRNCLVFTRSVPDLKKVNELCTYINPSGCDVHRELKKYGRACIIGGSEVYSYFMDDIDGLYLTVEPISFGSGISLFNRPGNLRLSIKSVQKINDRGTVLIHYGN